MKTDLRHLPQASQYTGGSISRIFLPITSALLIVFSILSNAKAPPLKLLFRSVAIVFNLNIKREIFTRSVFFRVPKERRVMQVTPELREKRELRVKMDPPERREPKVPRETKVNREKLEIRENLEMTGTRDPRDPRVKKDPRVIRALKEARVTQDLQVR